jgi:hypothetical protein
MNIDIFTKVILTLIAVALWGLLLQPIFSASVVGASTGVIDVNVKQIDGRNIVGTTLDVNLQKLNGRTIYNALPVEINK